MGRVKQPHTKEVLLEQAVLYVLDHGLQDLSLRPLAKALGTNARMLIYHFGDKDKLIAEVLTVAIQRQQQAMQAMVEERRFENTRELLEGFWERLTAPQARAFMRLLFEVDVLGFSGHPVYSGFSRAALEGWVGFVEGMLEAVMEPGDHKSLATNIVAGFNGLILDLFATGDEARVRAAFEAFVRALEGENDDSE